MNEQQIKDTYVSRVQLDSDFRCYVCDEEVKKNYTKSFQLVKPDARLLHMANDDLGSTSDCFILYAICRLGSARKEAIIEFLQALLRKNPSLHIVCSQESIQVRLRYLHTMGLIVRFLYPYHEGKDRRMSRGSLFVATEEAYAMVKQHLKKQVVSNQGFYAKHIKDLIGWAAASFAGSLCANKNRGFIEFTDGIFRTKQMGAIFFPCEFKSQVNDETYYVAFAPGYIEYDSSYMSNKDFDEVYAYNLNMIRNYLNCRTQKGTACMVIVIEDNADLNQYFASIIASGAMQEMFDRIYFTGEGVLRYHCGNEKKAFFQIIPNEDAKEGYSICAVNAPFMS